MSELFERLQHANQTLSRLLEVLAPDNSPRVVLTHHHLTALLAELLRVAECLQAKADQEGALEELLAIREYHAHLERLRVLLPTLHAELLTERARLESERSHLEAATAWTGSARDTT